MTHTIIIEGQRDAVSREYRDMAKTQFAEFGLRKTDVVVSVEATRGGNVEACIARASVGAPMFFRYDATGRHAIANPYATGELAEAECEKHGHELNSNGDVCRRCGKLAADIDGEPVRLKLSGRMVSVPMSEDGECEVVDVEPETVPYVVAGVATLDGKKVVTGAIVDVPASLDDFSRDLRALDALPSECLTYRGQNAAQAWPLDSAEGMTLALKLHLMTPVQTPALEESTEAPTVTLEDAAGEPVAVRADELVGYTDVVRGCDTCGAECSSRTAGATDCTGWESKTPDVGRKGGTAGGSLLVEPSSVKPRKSLGGSRVSKREAGSYRYDWGGVSFSVVRQSFGDRPNVWNVYLLGAENVFIDFFETKTAAVEFLNGYALEYATAVSREYWKHDDEKRERAGVVVGAEVELHYRGRDYVGRVTEVVKTGLDPVRVRVVFKLASGGSRVRVPVWRAVRVVDQTNDAR